MNNSREQKNSQIVSGSRWRLCGLTIKEKNGEEGRSLKTWGEVWGEGRKKGQADREDG